MRLARPGAARQLETLTVPLIDAFRPGLDHGKSGRRRPHRVIADLGVAGGMAKHLAAEMLRAHLRAKANAEKLLVVAQRHADPVDLAADEIVVVIGAHRTAENHGCGMFRHGFRQGLAKARPRTSSGYPNRCKASPMRPGVECSWCRTIRIGKCMDGVIGG